ncbi:hypothetical protein [Kribbella hippodromi]
MGGGADDGGLGRRGRAGVVGRIHGEAARLVAERADGLPSVGELPVASELDRAFVLRPDEQPIAGIELTYRARGNEQLVYTADQYPGVAFKVHWFDTKLVLEGLGVEAGSHWLDGTIGAAGRNALLAHAEQTAQRLRAMEAAFGEGHSLPRSCGAIEFPFPGRVLRALKFPEVIDPDRSYPICTPITVQEWRSLEGGIDFATGMQPPNELSAADVTRAGQKWIERSLPPGFEPELLRRLAPDSTVPAFLDAVRNRPELAASARAFVDSAREYTRDTGELFALRGRKNLYFDADGTFRMIDTMGRPPAQNSIGKVHDRLLWIKENERPLPLGVGHLAPVVSTIAALNALADEVGTGPYWEMPDDLKPYPWDTYFNCIDWQTDGLPHEKQSAEKRQAEADARRPRSATPIRQDGLSK